MTKISIASYGHRKLLLQLWTIFTQCYSPKWFASQTQRELNLSEVHDI